MDKIREKQTKKPKHEPIPNDNISKGKIIKIIDSFKKDVDDLIQSTRDSVTGNKMVECSTLLRAVKGDRVRCMYRNSGNKFWYSLFHPYVTVDKIKYNESAGICQFTFKEDKHENNFFFENDFEKIR
jgi:hypothetical protein